MRDEWGREASKNAREREPDRMLGAMRSSVAAEREKRAAGICVGG